MKTKDQIKQLEEIIQAVSESIGAWASVETTFEVRFDSRRKDEKVKVAISYDSIVNAGECALKYVEWKIRDAMNEAERR
ncbi:hypothetical protein [Paracoccus sp. (in: a-proteobacteria)]|uniref:hypothetical protein n=1 Tax=Paracoccus sp. TaxID=267 RepID=UPI00405A2256